MIQILKEVLTGCSSGAEKFDAGDIIQQDTIKGIIIDRNDKTKEYGII